MLAKINPENLFIPNFRPSPKLVWDGSKFKQVPANELAIMVHPKDKKKMMVVEPTATNLVTNSTEFTGSANIAVEEADSLIEGYLGSTLTNVGASPTNYTRKNIGALSQNNASYIIIKRETADKIAYGIRDTGTTPNNWAGFLDYTWSTDTIKVSAQSGTVSSYGKLELSEDTIILWLVVVADNVGNTGEVFFYPGYDGTGKSTTVYHMQAESTRFWSSPIITGASAVSRAADIMTINKYSPEFSNNPKGTMYAETSYPTGAPRHSNSRIIQEGINSSNALIMYPSSLNTIRNRAYISLGGNSLVTGSGLAEPDTVGALSYAASFSKIEIAASLKGKTSFRENTINELPQIPRITIGGPVSEPLWIGKIWRDTKVRNAEQLSELTS